MRTVFRQRINSFVYAFRGLVGAVRTQLHMKVHLFLAGAALAGCAFFQVKRWEWVAVVLCIGLVMALEVVNTAAEQLVDWLSPGYHPAAGKIKDTAAGAVLVAAIASLAVGLIIFTPYIQKWITK